MIDNDTDIIDEREVKAVVQIIRVDNGYRVRAHEVLKKKRTIQTLLGKTEVGHREVDLVFHSLAEVVEWLGKHYQEPTRSFTEITGVQNG